MDTILNVRDNKIFISSTRWDDIKFAKNSPEFFTVVRAVRGALRDGCSFYIDGGEKGIADSYQNLPSFDKYIEEINEERKNRDLDVFNM